MSWREILNGSTGRSATNPSIQSCCDTKPKTTLPAQPKEMQLQSLERRGWRELLADSRPSISAHRDPLKAHNTQKALRADDSANTADSAHELARKDVHQLMEALSSACLGLQISPQQVYDALGDDGRNDWLKGETSEQELRTFAESTILIQKIDQGERPDLYNKKGTCYQCGDVWLWFEGTVLGCPWCWNRIAGKPIPRPVSVQCGNCKHFKRKQNHPALGHCSKGEPEPIAGLWATDARSCQLYIPQST